MTHSVIPYRVDLVVIYTDNQTGGHIETVRQGVTPDTLRHAADVMDRLSNAHPLVFGAADGQ